MTERNDSRPRRELPGLRERRRRQTCRDLADAAIDLFERHGVHGTTTDDIAEAAGISARTFFRYAATKENAIFLDRDPVESALHRESDQSVTEAEALMMIEDLLIDRLERFDAEAPDQHHRALRARRLILSEPSLLALALALDAEDVDHLTGTVLTMAPHADELRVRTLVTAVGTMIRLAIDEWARRAELGDTVSTRSLYDQIRRGFEGFFTR